MTAANPAPVSPQRPFAAINYADRIAGRPRRLHGSVAAWESYLRTSLLHVDLAIGI